MTVIEWLRIIFIGIVEGITEWLPVSSTGHMILVDAIWKTSCPDIMTDKFWEMFEVVIQLGAILAVVTLYFHKLNPFSSRKSKRQKRETWQLWGKVIVGCLPAAVLGLLLDDWIDAHFFNAYVVAVMLIVYGIAFIVLENYHKGKRMPIQTFQDMSYGVVLGIGLFQVLAMIPGTSRSGATILGAMLLGCSRYIAAEYTFYLAIPVMFGASGLKLVKFLLESGGFSGSQVAVLIVGMLVAYVVSILAIKFLVGYIKKNDFKVFGVYRILLGAIVLLYFLV